MRAADPLPWSGPSEFMDTALAVPILQPGTPAWGRQPSTAPRGQPGVPQLFFPKWKQPPSSRFQRPSWKHPPASAPAYSVFAMRPPGRRGRAPARR